MDEESLFAAALERSTGAERRAFLDGACAGDVALRGRMEQLLAAHEKTFCILDLDRPAGAPESPEVTAGGGAGDGPAAEHVGTVIAGRYRLIEEIGEGGMGTVWKAEQTQPVRRTVALKLIKAGMDSRSVQARFEAERQALALMDHPNIAKVHDGGTTEGGRPFFVMEYVKGFPISQYCDDARLSIAERLALFATVCRAVQHAHTKGVIHRDLKPSNILVCPYDGRPVPKVIDFGLAKAIHRPLTEHTLHTAHGVMMGSPLYMSPEQAALNNLDVDTRTDVYALGVVLYELLTGTTPLESRRFREAAWDEVLRLIKEEEPPRPSARLSGSGSLPSLAARRQLEPVRLTRLVRGELDWIVMKCLEKDRSRRYETASGLARDVERYLADESVEACPPSAGYRLGKLIRRHRGPVLAAAIIVLLLVGGIVGTTWGLIWVDRARKAEARANAQAQKRLRQIEKGSEILASVFGDLDPGAEQKEGKPLRAILGDRLSRAAEQVEGEVIGDPLLVARLQSRLGMSLLRLGMAPRAIPLHEKARATRASILGADHPDTLESMNNLAQGYRTAGKLDLALSLQGKTLRLRKAKLGPDHPDTLVSMNGMAVVFQDSGKLDLALSLYEEALRSQKAKLGADHPDTLKTLNNLAACYQAADRTDLALSLYQEAFRLRKARLGPDHPHTLVSMSNLAAGYQAAGEVDLAIPLYEEAIRLQKAKLGPDHPHTLVSMNSLAAGYHVAGKLGLAIPLYEEALRLRKARLGADHPDTLRNMSHLATGYQDSGKLGLAIPLYEEALGLQKARLGADHPDALRTMNNLAAAYQAAGKRDLALPLFEEAAVGVERRRFDHQDAAQIIKNMISFLEASNQFDEAEVWRRKWLAVARERAGADSPPYAGELQGLGANLLQQEKWADAEAVLREALTLIEKRAFASSPQFNVHSLLGGALLGQGRYAEAEPLLIRGYERVKAREARSPAPGQYHMAEAGSRIVELYEAWGRPEKAAEWRAKLFKPVEAEPEP